MFQLLFSYPFAAYRQGTLLWASGWSLPLLALLILLAVAAVAFLHLRHFSLATLLRIRRTAAASPTSEAAYKGPWPRIALAALQAATLVLLLLLLWRPALSVAQLQNQQNVVAVVLDTSASMALDHRLDDARRLLDNGLLKALQARFPVRLYTAGSALRRVSQLPAQPTESATNLGAALRAAAAESSTLPLGAIVLLSDGADNRGGLDQPTLAALRLARVPIHTVGFGALTPPADLELLSAELPARALPNSRLEAAVTLRQHGFARRDAKLTLRDGSAVVASRALRLPPDGETVRETLTFSSGAAGSRTLRLSLDPLDGESSKDNNTLSRQLLVDNRVPRLLYFEGEPRWEMKFLRRAADSDPQLALVSLVRTTQNKLYRQGIDAPSEVEAGFPTTVDDLFKYDAILLGNLEADALRPEQHALLEEFVSRRGGGLLFLAGRYALSDGAWNHAASAPLIPVTLPDRKGTFHRDPAPALLTQAGQDSLLTRLDEDPARNLNRWRSLPPLADYQETGPAKPGALVLAETANHQPLLVTQNYGRGRTALFATSGSWRWRMGLDSKDQFHPAFWQQLLRSISAPTPGRVVAQTSQPVYDDAPRVALRAEVRDLNYLPAPDAAVEAHLLGPAGASQVVALSPDPNEPGAYTAELDAKEPGAWLAEVIATREGRELGRSEAAFLRQDGLAEAFHPEQNKELLERLSALTKGRYYTPSEARALPDEIVFSEAGISARQTLELWHTPAALLLLAALKSAEWLLRRRWGAI